MKLCGKSKLNLKDKKMQLNPCIRKYTCIYPNRILLANMYLLRLANRNRVERMIH
jgi:hypothetical protein